MGKPKLKKKRMTAKQASRTLQRMQTYCNEMVGVLNAHQADPNEAMAATFAVVVRLAKTKKTSRSQFIDEATSAWDNLRKLPIDHDEMVLVDADIEKPWFKQPKTLLILGTVFGLQWLAFIGYALYWAG